MSFAGLGTAGTVAAIAGGTQVLGGLAQGIFSGRKAAEKRLNDLAQQSPLYTPSKSIQDYYQEAMNRYNQNPYQSAQYQAGQNAIQRGTASALNNLQGRGAAIAGAGRIALGQDTALTNLGTQAEAQRRANFGQYGQAAQQQAAEQAKAFQINQEDPYLRKFGLAQYNAQAANARQQAGWQTAAGGLSNIASVYGQGMKKPSSYTPAAVPNPLGLDMTSGISPTQQSLNIATPGWQ